MRQKCSTCKHKILCMGIWEICPIKHLVLSVKDLTKFNKCKSYKEIDKNGN